MTPGLSTCRTTQPTGHVLLQLVLLLRSLCPVNRGSRGVARSATRRLWQTAVWSCTKTSIVACIGIGARCAAKASLAPATYVATWSYTPAPSSTSVPCVTRRSATAICWRSTPRSVTLTTASLGDSFVGLLASLSLMLVADILILPAIVVSFVGWTF